MSFHLLIRSCRLGMLLVPIPWAAADTAPLLPVPSRAVAATDTPDARTAFGPMPSVIFAVRPCGPDVHYYANLGYYCDDPTQKAYREGGRLCRFDVSTGRATPLLNDDRGGVRDAQVHHDGRKVLFSYRPGGTEDYHLYEVGVDGQGLQQLTDGPFDDIEPTYLPDGDIRKRLVLEQLPAPFHNSPGFDETLRHLAGRTKRPA